MHLNLPKSVRIVEVGARDGLQNEKDFIPTEMKLALIRKLCLCGFKSIEATSFVSKNKMPQLADAPEIMQRIDELRQTQPRYFAGVDFPVLVPNLIGLDHAVEAGADSIAVFGSASESFCQKNTNCSVQESLERIEGVIRQARRRGIQVRGYLSCVLGCPYEGKVPYRKTCEIAQRMVQAGCYEISFGDTIGIGTPLEVAKLMTEAFKYLDSHEVAVHFHDTYGTALANIFMALQCQVTTVDSSIAGLGGCPYAPGALGNVASEDVVFMCEKMGIDTGVDPLQVIACAKFIRSRLGRPTKSRLEPFSKYFKDL